MARAPLTVCIVPVGSGFIAGLIGHRSKVTELPDAAYARDFARMMRDDGGLNLVTFGVPNVAR